MADVLFNLCARLILKDFRSWIQHNRQVPWLGNATPVKDFSQTAQVPPEDYLNVTIVDDCAVLIHAGSNRRILHLIQQTVQAFTHAASRRGLEVSFDQGKTEVCGVSLAKGPEPSNRSFMPLATLSDGHAITKILQFMCAISINT